MRTAAARVMMTMGAALLLLAIAGRFAPLSPASRVADDMAIVMSALAVVLGALYARRSG